jgi:hypothetical protein
MMFRNVGASAQIAYDNGQISGQVYAAGQEMFEWKLIDVQTFDLPLKNGQRIFQSWPTAKSFFP